MLKKKNIAIMTAIASVATSVAPVLAAGLETQYVNEDALLNEVERLLDVKYSNSMENGKGDNVVVGHPNENSVYDIRFEMTTSTGSVVSSGSILTVSKVKELIEDTKITNETLTLRVVDKGHREDEQGAIVAHESNEYEKYTTISTVTDVTTGATVGTDNIITTASTTTTVDGQNAVVLTLANGTEVEVRQDDYVLDMNRPVDANGNIVDKTTTGSLARTVVGFAKVETGKVTPKDMPGKEVAKLQYRENEINMVEMDLAELKDDQGYTQKGADLVNMLVAANNNSNTTTVVKDGRTYDIVFDKTKDITSVEAIKDGGYKVEVQLKATKQVRSIELRPERNVGITITADSQKELNELVNALTSTATVTVGSEAKYGKLAGDSRFETAVEISKATYDKHDATTTAIAGSSVVKTASAVVLVGESAVVDGLAAAPLAKQQNAPILFAKKDVITEETMNEIKRVIDKNDTIYIVGGESVISKDVEAQLIKEMNANIVRLAGEDRNETSIKIAEEMQKQTSTVGTVYVVGGDGEADAMSIAAFAAQSTTAGSIAPVIVTPANGLTKDAKHFLKLNGVSTATVVGGEAKISTQVLKDIKDAQVTNVTRIAGNDRHETNRKVIENLYTSTASTVFVAKDGYVGGNDKLIDALAVAPLAAEKSAPIVLATDSITETQKAAIDKVTDETLTTNKLVQVGNGIASTVMNSLVKILGLNK